MKPLVTIVIPVYNGSNYLAEAIDSALNQTYNNIEVLVINDGSKDNGATDIVALSYGNKIRYITKENGGVSSALNLGIREMRGDYFSWLSHDDLYKPQKIEKEVAALQSKNDIVICSGSLMDADGKPMKHYTRTMNCTKNGRELFKEFLHGYVLNGLGFLIPRRVFDKVGLFDENMRYLQDLDFWLRMMWFDYKFICLDELLVVSRVHKNQVTNLAYEQFDIDRKSIARKHIEMLKNEKVFEREKLIKNYLLLFEKSQNREGIREITQLIKKENIKTNDLFFSIIQYRILGVMISVYRVLRDIRLKKSNMRS